MAGSGLETAPGADIWDSSAGESAHPLRFFFSSMPEKPSRAANAAQTSAGFSARSAQSTSR